MTRSTRRRLVVAGAAMAISMMLVPAQHVSAAMNVVVTVSPGTTEVGRPVEILIRTFVPVSETVLDMPRPATNYPVASGAAYLMFPAPGYPWVVLAASPDGTEQRVDMTLDAQDATLWRGSFVPGSAGRWTVQVASFPDDDPGAVAAVEVSDASPGLAGGQLPALVVGLVAGAAAVGAAGTLRARRRS